MTTVKKKETRYCEPECQHSGPPCPLMQCRIECNELQQSGTPYTLMLYLGKCRAPKCAQFPPGPWPHQAARGREETPVGMHGGLSTRLDARGRGRVRKSLARGRVRKSLAPGPRSRLQARGRRITAQVAITRLKPRLCFPPAPLPVGPHDRPRFFAAARGLNFA